MLGVVLFPLADPFGKSLIAIDVVGITAAAIVTSGFIAMAYYVYLVRLSCACLAAVTVLMFRWACWR